MVPLALARACAALNCPKAMVWVWLVHQARKTGKRTVAVPNRVLAKYGVSREVKRRALRQLEAAGLITVERRPKEDARRDFARSVALFEDSTVVQFEDRTVVRLAHTVPFLSYPFLSNQ